jgi:hypothetical protein
MKHYTYIHYRKDNNLPFYIGKGSGGRAGRVSDRNKHWHNINQNIGFYVGIVAPWETEEEAYEHETFLIDCFRDMGYKLVNYLDGGNKPPSWKGRKQSPEHIAKRMAAKLQNGRMKHTEITKQKIRDGVVKSQYVHTEEHRRKNSVGVKLWWDKSKGLI